jgi:membrane-associated protein
LDLVQDLFRTLYNVPELIRAGGLLGLILVVFAETGLLIGFFLPGDSLLVTAGLFAARGDLDIASLNLALMAAAILGDATGYWIGYRTGQALYSRPNSLLFRREHLVRTHEFYEKHGGKTIVIARFMPILRTFAPVVAGAAAMTYRRFAVYNVVGGIGWVASMTLTGYFLGRTVPNIEKNLHLVVAVVIGLSLLPGVIAWLRARPRPATPAPSLTRDA